MRLLTVSTVSPGFIYTAAALCVFYIFTLALSAHTYFFHLTEVVGLEGFSVLEYMEHQLHPENFTRDFPGGISVTGSSIITLLYVPLHQFSGWSGITLMTVMIGAEMAFVMAGAWVLWNMLLTFSGAREDYARNNLHLWMYVWLCALLLVSKLTSPDLANFRFPYFHGQFYGFADGLRLAAIALALNRRWGWVAILLCLGFTIHPIKTCFAAVFILAMALLDRRHSINARSVLLGFFSALFAGIWAYFMLLQGGNAEVTPIAADEFIAFTRIFQYHWYPFDSGVLTRYHDIVLSPFLAVMMMVVLAMAQSKMALRIVNQIRAGYAAMFLLSMAGMWVSAESTSTWAIAFCLLRASELMTLLAPFLMLLGLGELYRRRQWHWVAIYAVFLAGSFLASNYMSPAFASFAAALYFYEERKTRVLFSGEPVKTDWLLAVLAPVSLAVSVYFWGHYPERVNPLLFSVKNMAACAAVFVLLLCIGRAEKLKHAGRFGDVARIVLFTAAIAVFASMGAIRNHRKPTDYLDQARAFLEVQLWAKNHTENTALFMVDPCQNYGWRDFSSRSSIGTPREWFMTSWAYVPDGRVLERGKKIGGALGLDMKPFIAPRSAPRAADSTKVCVKAQELFYAPDGRAIQRLTKEFDINYYVMLKEKAVAIRQRFKGAPAFENNFYTVYAAKELTR